MSFGVVSSYLAHTCLMFKAKFLIPLGLLLLFLYLKFIVYQPPVERQQIRFTDSVQSVQDSMRILRQICESVEPEKFINCYTNSLDSVLHFKGESIGKIDSVSVSNEAFKDMSREDVIKLLSVVKFLNRNFIAGIIHDTSVGFWLYSYRDDVHHSGITGIRNLFIWNESKDTLNPAFTHYFTILDRKERLLLLSHNNVRYKQF